MRQRAAFAAGLEPERPQQIGGAVGPAGVGYAPSKALRAAEVWRCWRGAKKAKIEAMDSSAVEDWIRAHVTPVGSIETAHQRPWATVLRVPLANSVAWFKACAPVQAFEPRLTGELFGRWPDRVAEVLGQDNERGWLLLADAGTPVRALGNPPEAWLAALPLYAELQRCEAKHMHDHLAHGVPDLRLATLPARYEDLLQHYLPLEADEIRRLIDFQPRVAGVCDDLAVHDLPETVQHDDLHAANLYLQDGRLRVLDWGDSSISHPFASLVVIFRFLEQINKLLPGDRWFPRLRDAYLEPWEVASSTRLRSASGSARSRTRSPGGGSGMPCLRRHAPSSIKRSASCCGAQSPTLSTKRLRRTIRNLQPIQ